MSLDIEQTFKHVPEHDCPLPENPLLQVQLKEPSLLKQVASTLQLWVFTVHSLMSENVTDN